MMFFLQNYMEFPIEIIFEPLRLGMTLIEKFINLNALMDRCKTTVDEEQKKVMRDLAKSDITM